MKTWVLGIALFAAIAPAHAHKFSDSYLHLDATERGTGMTWDIALRDLDLALDLDRNGDGRLTWGEIRTQRDRIELYALSRLTLQRDEGACSLTPADMLIDHHSDGAYAALRFDAHCERAAGAYTVDYRLLFDLDPQHRGVLSQSGSSSSYVLAPDRSRITLDADSTSGSFHAGSFFAEGIHHILTGYDHVLFLLTLLAPAVLLRRAGRWVPAQRWSTVLIDVARIVSAFTLAHSVTLGLAATHVISLPSQLVESAIALSVVLAALNNLWPVVTRRLWLVAFGFGLIHGFGFASVLADGLRETGTLIWSLAMFNAGVEVGQFAIVALVLPLAYALRRLRLYRRRVLPAASAFAALIGMVWLIERVA